MQDTDNEESDDENQPFANFGFCGVEGRHLLYLIIMLLVDNQSTVNLFWNKKYVKRVWTTDEFTTVKVNGETINTTRKSNVKVYGEVWFDEWDIINIFALKNINLNSRVTYNRNDYGLLTFHNHKIKELHFNMHKDGLNYHTINNRHVILVQTTSETESGYRKHHINNAKLARKLYAKVGNPHQKYFNNVIKPNLINNFLVTTEEANQSNKIYEPNISAL